jgi:hypothetical protein
MAPQRHLPRLCGALLGVALATASAITINDEVVAAPIGAASNICFESGAPEGAGVVLNGTAARASGSGFLNFYRPGESAGIDENSSLNFTSDANIANTLVIPVGDGGEVCVYSSAQTDVLADVAGFISPTRLFTFALDSGDPQTFRVFDSREDTVDRSASKFTGGEQVCISPVGTADVGDAWFMNVTAVAAESRGFVNVYPKGVSADADAAAAVANSAVNFVPGRNIANGVTVTVGVDREVCMSPSATTHILLDLIAAVDVTSFRSANADNTAKRVLDTRDTGTLAAQSTICVDTEAALGEAVVVNGTAVRSSKRGFLNIFSAGAADPAENSSINFRPDANIANGVIIAAGTDGQVCVFANQRTDVVLDIAGYLTEGAFIPINADGSANRVLDTRD